MLVPFLPNTYMSGGQTRWYNIIRYLSKNHEITLFSLIKDESERRFIPDLEKYCKKVLVFRRPRSPWTLRNILLTAFSYYPLLVIRNWSYLERLAIRDELKKEKYDLIHAETFYVMPHLPDTNIPTILVEQTIEYLVYKHHVDTQVPWFLRPIFMIDVYKLRYWEKHFWKKAHKLVAVSDDDRKIMQKEIKGIKVEIIPNGIDSAFYSEKKYSKYETPRVLYVGNFKWLQNVEAVNYLIKEVWPKIISEYKNAKLWIVGRSIPSDIKQLSNSDESIEFSENMKETRKAYQKSMVMVVPIFGPGGTRLKVLEALAAGLPVVSTSIGVAGLHVEDGKHVVVSDTAEGLAKATIDILNRPKYSKEIGLNGQNFVKDKYDWKTIVKIHDEIYNQVIK